MSWGRGGWFRFRGGGCGCGSPCHAQCHVAGFGEWADHLPGNHRGVATLLTIGLLAGGASIPAPASPGLAADAGVMRIWRSERPQACPQRDGSCPPVPQRGGSSPLHGLGAMLPRPGGHEQADGDIAPRQLGDLAIDSSAREVSVGGRPVELTRLEFDLLLIAIRMPVATALGLGRHGSADQDHHPG
jgi:hypothetical protein